MNKWPGEQNGGSHCHRTEYRKRIQNNDSEDDPGPKEKKGDKD